MGVKYYVNTAGITWGPGTVNTAMTNLYDKFVPVIIPITAAYNFNRAPRIQTEENVTVYDLKGRVVSMSNGKGFTRSAASRNAATGIYLLKGKNMGSIQTMIR